MAAQATFFSPAKYGIVPEVLPDAALSRANGLLEMSTFAAIVIGSTVGGLMYASWHHKPLLMGGTLLAIAVAGTWTSFGIPRGTGGRPELRVQLNPFAGLGNGMHELRKNRALLLAALGIGYFWFIGALLQLVILLAGKESMHLDDVRIALMGSVARDRHRRRQHGRGPVVGTEGRARTRADWRVRHGLSARWRFPGRSRRIPWSAAR